MADVFSEDLFESSIDQPEVKDKVDTKSIEEIVALQLEAFSLKNKDYAQNIEQRKIFASLIFSLVCIWLTMVLMILIAVGMGKLDLSDTVLSLLIGTTTANVCGFLLFVVKFLFNVEASIKNEIETVANKRKKKQK